MRVGIPRCLSYFYLLPLYRTFLEELGVETVESPPTSAKDLDRLSLCPTDEPCVSVKVAFAHAKHLLDGGVDTLFVPSIISLSETAYYCPKLMGLPSMLRAGLELQPRQMVSPIIDVKDDPTGWRQSWVHAAWLLGVGDRRRAIRALDRGLDEWREANRRAVQDISGPRAGPVTGIMGHAYVLDDIFGQKVAQVAREYGRVVLPEMVSSEDARAQLATLFDGYKMWTIEAQILGAALHILRNRLVDRLVFVSAFSCGPASIIENYIAKEAEASGIPFINIAVDEHTGEAGLVTRMEAFLDSVQKQARSFSAPLVRTAAVSETPAREGPIGLISMGNLDVPLATLLTEVGAEIVPAPPLSDEIVNLGREIAPEFICSPMVTAIGQMRMHAQRGVNKVIMVQGKGRCRLGWYAQIMEVILRRNGYPINVLSIDSPFPLRTRGRLAAESVRALVGKVEPLRIARALELAVAKLYAIDRASDLLREARAFEEARGSGEACFNDFVRVMASASSNADILREYLRHKARMRAIPRIDADPLHVELIGEIYVVNEPFVNKQVEKTLGSLERRVRVHRKLDLSNWVSYHLLKTPGAVRDYRTVTAMAEPYLPVAVGGHGQESVGEAVLAKRHGYDGVLHLFPFTCMPEIIAQNVLVKISRDLDLPVLSLMLSEQTGVAGLTTRLEAFCDLLEGRRKGRRLNEVQV